VKTWVAMKIKNNFQALENFADAHNH
jgi:hypothetical protein